MAENNGIRINAAYLALLFKGIRIIATQITKLLI